MKRYERKFQEAFKKVLEFRDYNIYDTDHSVERYKERVGKNIFLYEKLLKKGINYLINKNLDQKEDRYIFYSKKYGFGIQVHWREDRYTGEFAGYSATTLSEEEMKFFTKKDKQIFLEQLIESGYKETANDICDKGYHRYEFTESLKEQLNICGYDLYIQSGDIRYNFELIEF